MGINMRTETEMLDVILKTAETLQVEAVAMSGSRTNPKTLVALEGSSFAKLLP